MVLLKEGKTQTKTVKYYNLDAIISIGIVWIRKKQRGFVFELKAYIIQELENQNNDKIMQYLSSLWAYKKARISPFWMLFFLTY